MEEAGARLLGRQSPGLQNMEHFPFLSPSATNPKTAGSSSQWSFFFTPVPLMRGYEQKIPTTLEEGDPRGA